MTEAQLQYRALLKFDLTVSRRTQFLFALHFSAGSEPLLPEGGPQNISFHLSRDEFKMCQARLCKAMYKNPLSRQERLHMAHSDWERDSFFSETMSLRQFSDWLYDTANAWCVSNKKAEVIYFFDRFIARSTDRRADIPEQSPEALEAEARALGVDLDIWLKARTLVFVDFSAVRYIPEIQAGMLYDPKKIARYQPVVPPRPAMPSGDGDGANFDPQLYVTWLWDQFTEDPMLRNTPKSLTWLQGEMGELLDDLAEIGHTGTLAEGILKVLVAPALAKPFFKDLISTIMDHLHHDLLCHIFTRFLRGYWPRENFTGLVQAHYMLRHLKFGKEYEHVDGDQGVQLASWALCLEICERTLDNWTEASEVEVKRMETLCTNMGWLMDDLGWRARLYRKTLPKNIPDPDAQDEPAAENETDAERQQRELRNKARKEAGQMKATYAKLAEKRWLDKFSEAVSSPKPVGTPKRRLAGEASSPSTPTTAGALKKAVHGHMPDDEEKDPDNLVWTRDLQDETHEGGGDQSPSSPSQAPTTPVYGPQTPSSPLDFPPADTPSCENTPTPSGTAKGMWGETPEYSPKLKLSPPAKQNPLDLLNVPGGRSFKKKVMSVVVADAFDPGDSVSKDECHASHGHSAAELEAGQDCSRWRLQHQHFLWYYTCYLLPRFPPLEVSGVMQTRTRKNMNKWATASRTAIIMGRMLRKPGFGFKIPKAAMERMRREAEILHRQKVEAREREYELKHGKAKWQQMMEDIQAEIDEETLDKAIREALHKLMEWSNEIISKAFETTKLATKLQLWAELRDKCQAHIALLFGKEDPMSNAMRKGYDRVYKLAVSEHFVTQVNWDAATAQHMEQWVQLRDKLRHETKVMEVVTNGDKARRQELKELLKLCKEQIDCINMGKSGPRHRGANGHQFRARLLNKLDDVLGDGDIAKAKEQTIQGFLKCHNLLSSDATKEEMDEAMQEVVVSAEQACELISEDANLIRNVPAVLFPQPPPRVVKPEPVIEKSWAWPPQQYARRVKPKVQAAPQPGPRIHQKHSIDHVPGAVPSKEMQRFFKAAAIVGCNTHNIVAACESVVKQHRPSRRNLGLHLDRTKHLDKVLNASVGSVEVVLRRPVSAASRRDDDRARIVIPGANPALSDRGSRLSEGSSLKSDSDVDIDYDNDNGNLSDSPPKKDKKKKPGLTRRPWSASAACHHPCRHSVSPPKREPCELCIKRHSRSPSPVRARSPSIRLQRHPDETPPVDRLTIDDLSPRVSEAAPKSSGKQATPRRASLTAAFAGPSATPGTADTRPGQVPGAAIATVPESTASELGTLQSDSVLFAAAGLTLAARTPVPRPATAEPRRSASAFGLRRPHSALGAVRKSTPSPTPVKLPAPLLRASFRAPDITSPKPEPFSPAPSSPGTPGTSNIGTTLSPLLPSPTQANLKLHPRERPKSALSVLTRAGASGQSSTLPGKVTVQIRRS